MRIPTCCRPDDAGNPLCAHANTGRSGWIYHRPSGTIRIGYGTLIGAHTMSRHEARKTIEDFGDQWTRFPDNSGYYADTDLFADILSPLLGVEDLSGMEVAEIGSGTGRIVTMLLAAGARHVAAIEPSRGFDILSQRFSGMPQRVTCHRASGEVVAGLGPFDMVLSIGVLHHIPNPHPVVRAALASLKPGGAFFVWLYASEGNRLYLSFAKPLRALTTRLPDRLLEIVVRVVDPLLAAYIGACRIVPLPTRKYMLNVLGRLSADERRLVIFDQLNPACAKYYTRQEAIDLLTHAGFVDVRTYHRHGYSWSVLGYRPRAE